MASDPTPPELLVDEKALTGGEPGLVEYRLPRGGAGQRQRRRLHKIEVGRLARHVCRLNGDVLGKGAAVCHAKDRVPGLEAADALAEPLNRAHELAAEMDGQGHAQPLAGATADLPVHRIDPRCMDLHQHLVRLRLRTFDVDDAHQLVVAVLVDDCRLHLPLLRRSL